MYYSLFDNDNPHYLLAGLNLPSKKACIKIVEGMLDDSDELPENWEDLPDEEKEEFVVCMCNYDIQEHSFKIDEYGEREKDENPYLLTREELSEAIKRRITRK